MILIIFEVSVSKCWENLCSTSYDVSKVREHIFCYIMVTFNFRKINEISRIVATHVEFQNTSKILLWHSCRCISMPQCQLCFSLSYVIFHHFQITTCSYMIRWKSTRQTWLGNLYVDNCQAHSEFHCPSRSKVRSSSLFVVKTGYYIPVSHFFRYLIWWNLPRNSLRSPNEVLGSFMFLFLYFFMFLWYIFLCEVREMKINNTH